MLALGPEWLTIILFGSLVLLLVAGLPLVFAIGGVAPVGHVVVDGEDHQRRVRHDAAQHAGVEGEEAVARLGGQAVAEGADGLVRVEDAGAYGAGAAAAGGGVG